MLEPLGVAAAWWYKYYKYRYLSVCCSPLDRHSCAPRRLQSCSEPFHAPAFDRCSSTLCALPCLLHPACSALSVFSSMRQVLLHLACSALLAYSALSALACLAFSSMRQVQTLQSAPERLRASWRRQVQGAPSMFSRALESPSLGFLEKAGASAPSMPRWSAPEAGQGDTC